MKTQPKLYLLEYLELFLRQMLARRERVHATFGGGLGHAEVELVRVLERRLFLQGPEPIILAIVVPRALLVVLVLLQQTEL